MITKMKGRFNGVYLNSYEKGEVDLFKSTLSSLLVYFMSLLTITNSVEKIERLNLAFLMEYGFHCGNLDNAFS